MIDTFLFLLVDGLTSGLVYALLALSLVLVFTVTRVVNIAQGEYVMLGALTLADLLQGRVPGTLYLLAGGTVLCLILDADRWRRDWRAALGIAAGGIVGVVAAFAMTRAALALQLPPLGMMAVALVLVAPLGAMVYRFTVHPIPNATTIVFVIISVGVDMVLQGLGLLIWGANPYPVDPVVAGGATFGPVFVPYQSFAILITALLSMGALYLFSEFTLLGKALQASAMNRLGAQFCGIPVNLTGAMAFLLAAGFSALSGMLLAPLITANYEMGFMVGLKGFVGAALGGLIDYPLSLAGVMLVGSLESASAYAASAYRDALVFSLLIPVLLWRNARQRLETK
ncbi:branched-chain amino acid ABC transporter permease [Bradyrhizobium sp. U87765 SZCCT0131]|uniref:branched-chain amino acid ABC transporter permease n=1 Tax=unclassified Bradyrhizobium TaxID=2631580 RepID=UPI001BABA683|nr:MULTISPECIES: branched-chain amino acid ABC transporter permease [unclassified Bradyrhizobium]MBR1217527.1 branched-chain amino acid ABC transporter permease [Bradyrhizobium sp. U87765 SZCCT0131]MBR1264875.1 branched-chain amino acid ABC transporter permease [Bradyrhizobium sp. U87765 SZCCT0134]MBR1304857.1 branched-chain amino acid ABC transporter permease [Bradyrhizobium sp. U87765 SZCCT0110]MBR1320644.1 branched-chain amino acid ABC transporter permease [Bradyrhizobium sp. U87765 SZCCT010